MKPRLLLMLFLAMPVPVGTADEPAPAFVYLQASDMDFQPLPDLPGLAVSPVLGNPQEPGTYVIRVRFGPGVMSPPHFHDQDRLVTVISGVWAFGMDGTGRCEGTVPLMAGAFAMHPKGAVHYDGSCNGEEVVVQIIGTGPVRTTWLETGE